MSPVYSFSYILTLQYFNLLAVNAFALTTLADLVLPSFMGALLMMGRDGTGSIKSEALNNDDKQSSRPTGEPSDEWDDFWDRRRQGLIGSFLVWGRRRYVTPKLVELVLGNTVKGVLVEAGCGTGEVSLEVAKRRGDKLCLVDISEKALTLAKRSADHCKVSAITILGDIKELGSLNTPRADTSVFNIGVIEHFVDCKKILNEMAKASENTAFAVIPEKSLFWNCFVKVSTWLKLVPEEFYIRLYSEAELCDLVRQADLVVAGVSRTKILGIISYLGVKFCRPPAVSRRRYHEK